MSEAWNVAWSWLTSTIGNVAAGDPAWRIPVGAALIALGIVMLVALALARRAAAREARRVPRPVPTPRTPVPSGARVVAIPTLAAWSASPRSPTMPGSHTSYGANPDRPTPTTLGATDQAPAPVSAMQTYPVRAPGVPSIPGVVVARVPEPVLTGPTQPLASSAVSGAQTLARGPATPSRLPEWRTIHQAQPTTPLAGVGAAASETRQTPTSDRLVPITSGPLRSSDALAVADRAPAALPLRQDPEPWASAPTPALADPGVPAAENARAEALYRRGHDLANRTEGNVAQALRDALTAYRGAEAIWTRERAAERWAALQSDIGRVYQEIPDGDRIANLRTAILCYERALEVFEPVRHSINWAWTQSALGVAYQSLPVGSPVANARAAVAYHQRALDVFTPENCPLAWAWNMNNLGTAYEAIHGGPEGGMVAQLHEAARCYEEALEVYAADQYPVQHQVVARNLARVRAELRALE